MRTTSRVSEGVGRLQLDSVSPNTSPKLRFFSVGREIAKALSSELRTLRKNFLALFGFGGLVPHASTSTGQAIAVGLKHLMSDMQEVDDSLLKQAQENYSKRINDLLNEIKGMAETKISHLRGEGGAFVPTIESLLEEISEEGENVESEIQPSEGVPVEDQEASAGLPDDVNNEIQELTALIDQINSLDKENFISDAEKIIVRYAQTPEARTVALFKEIFASADLSVDLNLMVHRLARNPVDRQRILGPHKEAVDGWEQALGQEEDASNLYGNSFRTRLARQQEPRTVVANNMVNLLVAATERKIHLGEHFTPEEILYLNQSIGAANKPPLLWKNVKEIPLEASEQENAERLGNYGEGSFVLHKQLATQMATLLKPSHQRLIIKRLNQVIIHLRAGTQSDFEKAWLIFGRIDEKSVSVSFHSEADKKLLKTVFLPLKKAIQSQSASNRSSLLRAMLDKMSVLEHLVHRKTWFFHDHGFRGLNAAFFEESFREAMTFSPERLEQFLGAMKHAGDELSAIRLEPANLTADEQKGLMLMLRGLVAHVKTQIDQMRSFESGKGVVSRQEDQSNLIKMSVDQLDRIQNQLYKLVERLELSCDES